MGRRGRRSGSGGHPARAAEKKLRSVTTLDVSSSRASRSIEEIRVARYADIYRAIRETFPGVDPVETGWAMLYYACTNGCGFQHRVWLGLGVEGPDELEEHRVPCPFFCDVCPNCRERLAHDLWDKDEEFPPMAIPAGAARFVLPDEAQARQFSSDNYVGAAYFPY